MPADGHPTLQALRTAALDRETLLPDADIANVGISASSLGPTASSYELAHVALDDAAAPPLEYGREFLLG